MKHKFWEKGIPPSVFDECLAEDIDMILLIDGVKNEVVRAKAEVDRKEAEARSRIHGSR